MILSPHGKPQYLVITLSAAALTGSQKKADTVPGPASSRAWSRAASAASPVGSWGQIAGGT